jgi:AAA domain
MNTLDESGAWDQDANGAFVKFHKGEHYDPAAMDAIGKIVDLQAHRTEREPKAPPVSIAKGIGGGDFLAAYEPISYTIDGMLPSGYLYGLTARRGGGKTAWMIAASLAVMTGRSDILGREVEQGRVAYIVKENSADFRI